MRGENRLAAGFFPVAIVWLDRNDAVVFTGDGGHSGSDDGDNLGLDLVVVCARWGGYCWLGCWLFCFWKWSRGRCEQADDVCADDTNAPESREGGEHHHHTYEIGDGVENARGCGLRGSEGKYERLIHEVLEWDVAVFFWWSAFVFVHDASERESKGAA